MLIKLGESIKLFGLKDGISFVWDWYIGQPLKIWYRSKILRKPYCVSWGFFCKDKECKHTHLPYFPKAPKIGSEDKCGYCGEAQAAKAIRNPNDFGVTLNNFWWKVCDDCDELIMAQEDLGTVIGFGHVAVKHGFSGKVLDDIESKIKEHQQKVEGIVKRTGKKVSMVRLAKTEEGFEARDVLTGKEL